MSMTTGFYVLDDSEQDRPEWLRAWAACGREPFAHPAYLALFARGRDRACCAVSTTDDATTILPFLLRPIDSDDESVNPSRRAFDASSPYGYGGPYGTPGVDFASLLSGTARWMREEGVVSFFGRLALDSALPSELPSGANVLSDSQNVVVDLTRDSEDQWRTYDHKVRKNVNKARRSDLSVEVRDTFTDVTEFARLYSSTMDRRQASTWYYFDAAFFESIERDLPGGYIAAEVRNAAGILVSAELVLASDRYLYSYLGGTTSEAFELRPNDLLKHAVIDYGRSTGRVGYVLGGGLSADDGIFRYKRSFDRTGCIDFRRLTMVCDDAAYDTLVADRLAAARRTDADAHLQIGYFPLYRAPLVPGTHEADENGPCREPSTDDD